MKARSSQLAWLFAVAFLVVPARGLVAGPEESMHKHPSEPDSTKTAHPHGTSAGAAHEDGAMGGEAMHEHAGQHHAEHGEMATGLYGPYPMSRESSGTAWQPDFASHEGLHLMHGNWMVLVHGFTTAVYDNQGGTRGDEDVFGTNMLMGIARRSLGRSVLGFRAMLSAEPATIGKQGYPLLFQTGETADGRTPLIDRQHPHDLFMELAGTLSITAGDKSAFLYVGMPGEPALGPPAFMHRFSGSAAPLAPISHHWLDSTHITYGVTTIGIVKGSVKLEGSLFTGREPDEKRVGWDSPEMDSHAFRISYNPCSAWSIQTSFGRLMSPEQLHPEVNVDRTTASVMFNPRRTGGNTQVTLAWGRNRNRPGRILNMFLGEATSTYRGRHTIFTRVEGGEKNELFEEDDPRAERVFTVGQVSGGYIYDLFIANHLAAGIGGSVGVTLVPEGLKETYGNTPSSGTIFLRSTLK